MHFMMVVYEKCSRFVASNKRYYTKSKYVATFKGDEPKKEYYLLQLTYFKH